MPQSHWAPCRSVRERRPFPSFPHGSLLPSFPHDSGGNPVALRFLTVLTENWRLRTDNQRTANNERRPTTDDRQTRAVGNLLAHGNRREPHASPSKFRSRTERSDSNGEQRITVDNPTAEG